jgi:N-acetyl-beta-hexosaminidase
MKRWRGLSPQRRGLSPSFCPQVSTGRFTFAVSSAQVLPKCEKGRFATVSRGLSPSFYAYDPLDGIPEGERGLVLGGQCCNWSEYTCNETELQWKMWPRTCATAEVFWSPASRRDWADFLRRMAMHRRRLVKAGINCAPLK